MQSLLCIDEIQTRLRKSVILSNLAIFPRSPDLSSSSWYPLHAPAAHVEVFYEYEGPAKDQHDSTRIYLTDDEKKRVKKNYTALKRDGVVDYEVVLESQVENYDSLVHVEGVRNMRSLRKLLQETKLQGFICTTPTLTCLLTRGTNMRTNSMIRKLRRRKFVVTEASKVSSGAAKLSKRIHVLKFDCDCEMQEYLRSKWNITATLNHQAPP